MPEEVLRENVARAMWEVEQPNICGDDDCCTWQSIDDWRRETYLRLADAVLAVFRDQPDPRVARVLALADERNRQHAAYCCTVDCPDAGQHTDPTDPIRIEELVGILGVNPPALREHRTIPCPRTCTCPTGPDVAAIRAAVGGTA